MQETSYSRKICMFCKQSYQVTTLTDDGMDWYGHKRGRPHSETIDNGCPYCGGDVVLAAEIVKADRQKEEERKRKFNEQLKGKFVCKVFWDIRGKAYTYVSNAEQTADYYRIGDDKIVYLESCEPANLAMLPMESFNNVKMFNGVPIDNKYITKLLTEEMIAAVKEDEFLTAKNCIEAIEHISNRSKLALKFECKMRYLLDTNECMNLQK